MTTTRQPAVIVVAAAPYTGGIFAADARISTVELVDEHGDFRQCGRGTRYGLTFTNEAQRLVSQGPIEPAAPRVFLNPQATVIADHYIPQAPRLPVRDGDLVVFADNVWQIREGNRFYGEYPKAALLITCAELRDAMGSAAARFMANTPDPGADFQEVISAIYRDALVEVGILTIDGDLTGEG